MNINFRKKAIYKYIQVYTKQYIQVYTKHAKVCIQETLHTSTLFTSIYNIYKYIQYIQLPAQGTRFILFYFAALCSANHSSSDLPFEASEQKVALP